MASDLEPLEQVSSIRIAILYTVITRVCQIFRKFEQTNEKHVAGFSSGAPPMDAENKQEGTSKRTEKEKRRSSISVSRFGEAGFVSGSQRGTLNDVLLLGHRS
jgi:hypothetical protein